MMDKAQQLLPWPVSFLAFFSVPSAYSPSVVCKPSVHLLYLCTKRLQMDLEFVFCFHITQKKLSKPANTVSGYVKFDTWLRIT